MSKDNQAAPSRGVLPLNSGLNSSENITNSLVDLMERMDQKVKKIAKDLYNIGALNDIDFIIDSSKRKAKEGKKNNVNEKKVFTLINPATEA